MNNIILFCNFVQKLKLCICTKYNDFHWVNMIGKLLKYNKNIFFSIFFLSKWNGKA